MKTVRHLCLGLILAGSLFAAPAAIASDTISYLKDVLTLINTFDSSVPAGSDIDPWLPCLTAPNVVDCVNLVLQNNPVEVDNTFVDTFYKIIQIYTAIDSGDFWGVVGVAAIWVKDNAPCLVAEIIAPGAGGTICGLIKELVELAEALVDAGEAIVAFIGDLIDLGGKVIEAISDAACAIGLGGCDEPPPPPPAWKVVYAQVYAPRVQAGVTAAESQPDNGLSDLANWLQPLANSVAGTYITQIKASTTISSAVEQASKQWKQTVDALWTADVMGKVNVAIGQYRSQYLQDIGSTIDKVIAEDAKKGANTIAHPPDMKIQTACNKAFSMYAHYDRWIDQHPNEVAKAQAAKTGDLTPKMTKNRDWCSDLGLKYKEQYLEQLAEYVDSVCPELMCVAVENYKACQGAMGGIGQKEQCLMDTGAIGYNAAYDIWKFLADRSQLAKSECKIDGKTPVNIKLVTAVAQAAGKTGSTQTTPTAKVGQSGQLVAQGPTMPGIKSSGASKTAVLGAIKTNKAVPSVAPKTAVLECPRPMHGYWCEKVYNDTFAGVKTGTFNLPLVTCKVTETEPYATMDKNVKTVLAANNFGLSAAYNDPLLVPVPTKAKFDLLANKDFFPQPPKQFAQLIAMQVSDLAKIDGVNEPTVFLDQSVGLKEAVKTVPVGIPSRPSPEAGKHSVSPVAGLAQGAKAPLNIQRGPSGQIGPTDKATSGQAPGRASAPSSPTTAKAAPVLNPAMAAAVAGSRATPSVANQLNPAIPTSGPAPQSRGAVPPASATAGRLGSVGPAATATPIGAGLPTVRSGAAASGPAPANQPPLSAQATVAATRSAPAAQPSTRSGPAPAATTTAAAATARPITPQLANAVTMAAQRDHSGAVRTFNAAAAPWKALTAPQAAPQGCPCAPLYAQISALQQRSATLAKEGESQVQNLNTGRLDAAATGKAAQHLDEISKQLDANMTQYKSLLGQYEAQLKNFRLQSAPAPVRR